MERKRDYTRSIKKGNIYSAKSVCIMESLVNTSMYWKIVSEVVSASHEFSLFYFNIFFSSSSYGRLETCFLPFRIFFFEFCLEILFQGFRVAFFSIWLDYCFGKRENRKNFLKFYVFIFCLLLEESDLLECKFFKEKTWSAVGLIFGGPSAQVLSGQQAL